MTTKGLFGGLQFKIARIRQLSEVQNQRSAIKATKKDMRVKARPGKNWKELFQNPHQLRMLVACLYTMQLWVDFNYGQGDYTNQCPPGTTTEASTLPPCPSDGLYQPLPKGRGGC